MNGYFSNVTRITDTLCVKQFSKIPPCFNSIEQALQHEFNVLSDLHSAGINCPQPVSISKYDDLPGLVMEFIPGLVMARNKLFIPTHAWTDLARIYQRIIARRYHFLVPAEMTSGRNAIYNAKGVFVFDFTRTFKD